MKVLIPGGSGHVGTLLARAFHDAGDEVVVLSRRPLTRPWRCVLWDGVHAGDWAREVEGAEAVINLAGRSVNCRYHAAHRREILESRVRSVRAVGEALRHAARPPSVWLQAGTATIYSHRYDAANDERCGAIGGDEPNAPASWRFSIDVARAWEGAFHACDTPRTRKVLLRSAMTMSPDAGGVFDAFLGLVRRGVGGAIGDGRQFVSWIHGDDFVRAIRWLIDRDDISGIVNVAAPNPLTNAQFMRDLRAAAHAAFGLPTPAWLLELGAALMKTESELVLKSRRVVPARLIDSGFAFAFPRWPDAARDLVEQWKQRRPSRAA
jgi:uncharacterized protein (TIGR01777 family)